MRSPMASTPTPLSTHTLIHACALVRRDKIKRATTCKDRHRQKWRVGDFAKLQREPGRKSSGSSSSSSSSSRDNPDKTRIGSHILTPTTCCAPSAGHFCLEHGPRLERRCFLCLDDARRSLSDFTSPYFPSFPLLLLAALGGVATNFLYPQPLRSAAFRAF